MGPESSIAGLASCEVVVKLPAGDELGLLKKEREPGPPLGKVRSLEGMTGGGALVKSEKISPLASKSVAVLVLGIPPPNTSRVTVG